MQIERADPWFEDLIQTAVLAGRWRETARACPAAADALTRAADRKTAVGAAIIQQNLDAQARITLSLGVFTSPVLGGVRVGDVNRVGAAGLGDCRPKDRPGLRQ